jgi:hypothetical protein
LGLCDAYANFAEDRIDSSRNLTLAADGSQSYQHDKKAILDQVLAFFAVDQYPELRVQLQELKVHIGPPPENGPTSGTLATLV